MLSLNCRNLVNISAIDKVLAILNTAVILLIMSWIRTGRINFTVK